MPTKIRRKTVRLRHGKRGFHFLVDGTVNSKNTCYYTRKCAAILGIHRFTNWYPVKIVDESGVSFRGNPKK